MANHSQPFYHLNLCLIGYVRIFVRLRLLSDPQTHFKNGDEMMLMSSFSKKILKIFMIQSAG